METVAHAKYIRVSPKKLREIARNVKGLAVTDATDRLTMGGKKAGRILAKVIQSAVANARQNPKGTTTNLHIKSIVVGKGPMLKRFQPVSRGMAHQIKKHTSHIKVIVEERKTHGSQS